MKKVLCIDNSGSTSNCRNYWQQVRHIYNTLQPEKLIFWNSTAYVTDTFEVRSGGGTYPQRFIELLINDDEVFDLIIATDGEISECDMEECSQMVIEEFLSKINSTTIHYIGVENQMNIGLNVIFGGEKPLDYYINAAHHRTFDNEELDTLTEADVLSPNFMITLISQIQNIVFRWPNIEPRKIKLAELRGKIVRLFNKLQRDSLKVEVEEQLEIYYKNNQTKEFVDLIAEDRMDVDDITRQKNQVLSMIDKKMIGDNDCQINYKISHLYSAPSIAQKNLQVSKKNTEDWKHFDDPITMEKFNLPGMLLQNIDDPLITDSKLLKHPFKLLSQPEIFQKLLRSFEPNPIDYTTYKKLNFDSKGFVKSPYTRVICKGIFVLDNSDMAFVKNNCRTISVIFGNENKVPGNLVLWNLVVLYLIYKYKLNETEYEKVILEEMKKYCGNYSSTITFTHQCQMPRQMKINVCLWYCIHAVPVHCPNTMKNVLRSSFGLELLRFYRDIFERPEHQEYIKDLNEKTKKWQVWNYLVSQNNRPKKLMPLAWEVQAQYQNYIKYNDTVIFVKGKCMEPLDSLCNLLDANIVNTLFQNLRRNSTKFDDIDNFIIQPVQVDCTDLDGVSEELTHVKINIKTCWPLVICPKTNKHWRECAGEYNVKEESYIRLFNNYCKKYKMYPDKPINLMVFYIKRCGNRVFAKRDFIDFELVFTIFEEVMKTYTCEEYISVYDKHISEELRLSYEQKV